MFDIVVDATCESLEPSRSESCLAWLRGSLAKRVVLLGRDRNPSSESQKSTVYVRCSSSSASRRRAVRPYSTQSSLYTQGMLCRGCSSLQVYKPLHRLHDNTSDNNTKQTVKTGGLPLSIYGIEG
jgi:hypothetical protein